MNLQLCHISITSRLRPSNDSEPVISCVIVIEDTDLKYVETPHIGTRASSDPSLVAKMPFELKLKAFEDLSVLELLAMIQETGDSISRGHIIGKTEEAA